MNGESNRDEPDELSVPEKIQLVQDLWDEIARSPRDVVPTEAQLEEAERRLREYETNPVKCSTWEEIKRRLENEL